MHDPQAQRARRQVKQDAARRNGLQGEQAGGASSRRAPLAPPPAAARRVFTALRLAIPAIVPVRAVGIDQTGRRLYLGLEDGVLEEYAVAHASTAVACSLAARRHVSKKVSRP